MPKLRKGFTLVELLVVVAIIALLISILLPSLARAREQAKKIKCLASMKDIGSASTGYSSEDESEFLLPWQAPVAAGDSGALISPAYPAFEYGGKAGHEKHWLGTDTLARRYYTQFNRKFGAFGGGSVILRWRGNGPQNRALNVYLYGSIVDAQRGTDEERMDKDNSIDMPAFRCPSDVGVQSGRDGQDLVNSFNGPDLLFLTDYVLGTPLYDATGNSYKQNNMFLFSPVYGQLMPGAIGASFSPYAREASQIPTPSRTVLYMEGNALGTQWWNSPWISGSNEELWATGWHGEKQKFEVVFSDGHAGEMDQNVRTNITGADDYEFEYGEYVIRGSRPENVNPSFGDLEFNLTNIVRGDGWQMDTQPAPMIPFSWQWISQP